jgi:hypothetical protein
MYSSRLGFETDTSGIRAKCFTVCINLFSQSPSFEGNKCSASQDIPLISWNPNVHYGINKGARLILSSRHSIARYIFHRLAVGTTPPLNHWKMVIGGLMTSRVNLPGCGSNHSALSSPEVRNARSVHPLLCTSSCRGAWLSTGTTLVFINLYGMTYLHEKVGRLVLNRHPAIFQLWLRRYAGNPSALGLDILWNQMASVPNW